MAWIAQPIAPYLVPWPLVNQVTVLLCVFVGGQGQGANAKGHRMNIKISTLIGSALLLAYAASPLSAQPADHAPLKPLKAPTRPDAARPAHLPLGVFMAVLGDNEKKALAALIRMGTNRPRRC